MRFGSTMVVIGILLIALGTEIFFEFGTESIATEVSGPEAWGTWTADNKTYYITGNITIPQGKTLVIEPGVNVIFNSSFHILVAGRLIANGTSNNRIEFTGSNFSTSGFAWHGLKFNTTGVGILQNCTIRNATTGVLLNNAKNVRIKNTYIMNNYYGLKLENNSNNNSFDNSEFYNNLYGIHLNNSHYNEIIECHIYSNNEYGILIENSSHNLINDSQIYNNYWHSFHGLGFRNGARYNSVIDTYIDNNLIEITNISESNIVFRYCTIYTTIKITNCEKVTIDWCWIHHEVAITNSEIIKIINCSFYWDSTIVLVEASDIEINHCDISTDNNGIRVNQNSKAIKIRNCQITRSWAYGREKQRDVNNHRSVHPISSHVTGIYLASVDNIQIHNTTISYYEYGLHIEDCNDTHMEDCQINTNDFYGVYIYGSSYTYIEHSRVINNNYGLFYSGYYYNHSNNFQVKNTVFSGNDNQGCGLSFSYSQATFYNCSFEENQIGLEIISSNNVELHKCKINNNSDVGLLLNTEKLSIFNSEINDNHDSGISTNEGETYIENCTLYNNVFAVELKADSPYNEAIVYLINSQYDSEIRISGEYNKAYIGWFVDYAVQTPEGTPVSSASVKVVPNLKNDENLTCQEYLTDQTGLVHQKICYQYLILKDKITEYNPYRIMAKKDGIGIAYKNISITKSEKITFVLELNDLKLTKITSDWQNNRVPVGEFFNITAEIENTANIDFKDVGLRFQITGSNVNITHNTTVSIPEQSKIEKVLEFQQILNRSGKYIINATIDFSDEIFEIDEKNNELSTQLFIIDRPVAVLEINRTTVYTDENITFSAGKSHGQVAILKYIFNFGDGNVVIEIARDSIEHNFKNEGNYNVTLQVIDIDGISSFIVNQTIKVIRRQNPITSPGAEFIINPWVGNVRTRFYFDSSLSIPSNGAKIVSYLWDFGDNNTSIYKSPIHEYKDDGTFEITLNITDSRQLISVIKHSLSVTNLGPESDLTANKYTVRVGEPVIFNANNTDDPDDTLFEPQTRFYWDFGDGDNYSESPIRYPDGDYDKLIEHIYNMPGQYNVTLVVNDDDGETDEKSITIVVLDVANGKKKDDSEVLGFNFVFGLGLGILLFLVLPILILFIRRRKSRMQALSTSSEDIYNSSEYYSKPTETGYGGSTSDVTPGPEPGKPSLAGAEAGWRGRKPRKKSRKQVSAHKRITSNRPVEVEVELPDEKVVEWKGEESAFDQKLSLVDADMVTNGELTQASIIGRDDEESSAFEASEYDVVFEASTETDDFELEEKELVFEPVEVESEAEEVEEFEEFEPYSEDPDRVAEFELVDELEDVTKEELSKTPAEQDSIVFEFEDDGVTRTTELPVSQKEMPSRPDKKTQQKHKKKDKLIAIPGIGFVTRNELQKAIGIDDDDFEQADFGYEGDTIPRDTPFTSSELKCKWCDKPIRGKYIKFSRKSDDDINFAIVGPFCSPECAAKFGK